MREEEVVEVRPANPRVRMEVGNLPHQSTDTYTEAGRSVTNTFNPNYMETFRFDDVYDGGLVARIYVEHTSTKKPEMMGKCAVRRGVPFISASRRWRADGVDVRPPRRHRRDRVRSTIAATASITRRCRSRLSRTDGLSEGG